MAMRELIEKFSEMMQEQPMDIEALLNRLQGICPTELAQALYTLEFHQNFSQTFSKYLQETDPDSTTLYFSRGLRQEVQAIYLEMAQHLKANNPGSVELMNRIFEFFKETMKSLVQVPYLVSLN